MIFSKWYKKYQNFRPFTYDEAWLLFRIAAISEAVSWTLLIIGIACKQLPVWWNLIPVGVAGVIHGALFLVYLVAVLLVAPSMGWGWFKTLTAGLFSIPPYGTLIFEQYAAKDRDWNDMKHLHGLVCYQVVLTNTPNNSSP